MWRSGERTSKHDLEPYWRDETDWLCTVEFLPTDDREARVFASHIIGYRLVILQRWRRRDSEASRRVCAPDRSVALRYLCKSFSTHHCALNFLLRQPWLRFQE